MSDPARPLPMTDAAAPRPADATPLATPPAASPRPFSLRGIPPIPLLLSAALFAVLFERPFELLVKDWWSNPEAGHGLLLAPLAVYFAWKLGIAPDARPNRLVGGLLLLAAVFFRYLSDLAAELFTMRGSMIMAAAGLTVWYFGFRQLLRWWLPFALIALSVPLPELILNRIALPLQFTASKIGAGLLAWRDIPVMLTGNVIRIPGHQLFVAEACSGLRSLTALLSLGVLLGAITLTYPINRVLLLLISIPVAIVLNGVRVFLTGFLVFFVDPALGEGFMHITEGWLIFLVAFLILGGVAWALLALERFVASRRAGAMSDSKAVLDA
ncbi:exosortase/archaeosortase family protein [Gemmatirosa kalamazoonensis]|nr:exosortase/archaeosortase family protein [Gemmatirosa kalamazoonensis]